VRERGALRMFCTGAHVEACRSAGHAWAVLRCFAD
jgi:hypothetical protein